VSTPAQPYPVVSRIPEDQPFVVHVSVRKWVLRAGLSGGVVLLMLLCLAGVTIAASEDSDGVAGAAFLLGICLLLALLLGLQIWRMTQGGPVLAAGPAGLWIRTRQTSGQAIWLPWEAIGLISRRRWLFDKMLVVQSRDPRARQNLGARTAFNAFNMKMAFGDGFLATLTMADRTESEILQAVAYYAANRVPLA
jgi:hypothetical protein